MLISEQITKFPSKCISKGAVDVGKTPLGKCIEHVKK